LDFNKEIYLINIRDIPPTFQLSPDDKMIFLIKGGGPLFLRPFVLQITKKKENDSKF
jgi:P pilus assembly chaperone PapD